MRLIVIRLKPVASASPRVLQCVCPRGVLSNVCTDDFLYLIITDLARSTRSRLSVMQSFQALFQESVPPLAYHAERTPKLLGHCMVVQAFATSQNHSCPPRQQRSTPGTVG